MNFQYEALLIIIQQLRLVAFINVRNDIAAVYLIDNEYTYQYSVCCSNRLQVKIMFDFYNLHGIYLNLHCVLHAARFPTYALVIVGWLEKIENCAHGI